MAGRLLFSAQLMVADISLCHLYIVTCVCFGDLFQALFLGLISNAESVITNDWNLFAWSC